MKNKMHVKTKYERIKHLLNAYIFIKNKIALLNFYHKIQFVHIKQVDKNLTLGTSS